jgi:methionyl aminopeptidase
MKTFQSLFSGASPCRLSDSQPMLNQGRRSVRTDDDGWTVVNSHGSLSAQFEHTVAVTASDVAVLTLRADEHSLFSKMKVATHPNL